MRMIQHENTDRDYERSRKLRNEASGIERKLWRVLSEQASVRGLKFRRQQPLHPYIADFACMAAKVLVEVDGDSHDGWQGYDRVRDAKLKSDGYEVLRFSNQEVVDNVFGVVETILNQTEKVIQEKQARQ